MKIFPSSNLHKVIGKKFILLDNDFLSALQSDEETFKSIIKDYPDLLEFGLIDQYTEFEFLRDLYIPEEFVIKEAFLSHFNKTSIHTEISKKLHKTALTLTKIYKLEKTAKKDPSLVDIFLGARMVIQDLEVITANKRDFPNCIFNTRGVITFIDEDKADTRNFYLLNVDQGKYEFCLDHLKQVEIEKKKEVDL